MPRNSKKRLTPEQAVAQAAEKRAHERRAGFESVGLAPEAANLAQNEGVQVEQLTRPDAQAGVKGNEKRSRRDDVFEALLRASALRTQRRNETAKESAKREEEERAERHRRRASLNAARRLEADVLMRSGHGDIRPMERVDGSSSDRCREDVMLDAADRVTAVLSRIGPRDGELLNELIEPARVMTADPERWRVAVRIMTGARDKVAQAERVRSACDNLAEAYRQMDHGKDRKVA